MGKKAKLIKNAQATKNVYDKILKEEIESLKNCPNLFDMKFTDVSQKPTQKLKYANYKKY